ncbi:MAG: hypothetical protein HY289_11905 [Planctomycetes bacterium]|nr:hypothetical protein [Planctomycetota bacterium]
MNVNEHEIPGPDQAVTAENYGEDVPAWEEIAPGRFMPRRVRGSCHGRVLG